MVFYRFLNTFNGALVLGTRSKDKVAEVICVKISSKYFNQK